MNSAILKYAITSVGVFSPTTVLLCSPVRCGGALFCWHRPLIQQLSSWFVFNTTRTLLESEQHPMT